MGGENQTMDIKDYQKMPEKALTFEEWKGSVAPPVDDEFMKSVQRMHGVDYKKEFDEMLRKEYEEYLDNLNGSWLLK